MSSWACRPDVPTLLSASDSTRPPWAPAGHSQGEAGHSPQSRGACREGHWPPGGSNAFRVAQASGPALCGLQEWLSLSGCQVSGL